eukprot:gene12274-biopygen5183
MMAGDSPTQKTGEDTIFSCVLRSAAFCQHRLDLSGPPAPERRVNPADGAAYSNESCIGKTSREVALNKNRGGEASEKTWRGLGTPGAASDAVLGKNWPGPWRLQKKTGAVWTFGEGGPVYSKTTFGQPWPRRLTPVPLQGAGRSWPIGVRSRPGMAKVVLKKLAGSGQR